MKSNRSEFYKTPEATVEPHTHSVVDIIDFPFTSGRDSIGGVAIIPLYADVNEWTFDAVGLRDIDETNSLFLKWNEDDTADRNLNFKVHEGDRTLELYENFTVGDGEAGTLTFSAASKTLTVENNSFIDQDLTKNSETVQFAEVLVKDSTDPLGTQIIIQEDTAVDRAAIFLQNDTGARAGFFYYGTSYNISKFRGALLIHNADTLGDVYYNCKDILPFTDNSINLGKAGEEFKDLRIDGLAYIDGLGEGIDCGDFAFTNLGHIDFDLTPSGSSQEGRLLWNSDDGTLDLGMPGGNVVLQVGQEIHLPRSKAVGSNIDNGQVVYISGASGSKPELTLARANAAATADCTIAVATEDITQNSNGYYTAFGLVRDIPVPVATFNDGDELWLDASTAGAFTNVKPTSPNYPVKIGYVILAHNTAGIIFIDVDKDYVSFGSVTGFTANSIPFADANGFLTENNPGLTYNGTDLLLTDGTFWVNGTTGDTPTSGAGTRLMYIPSKGGALRAGVVTGTDWDAANIGTSSYSFGVDNKVTGDYSTGIGETVNVGGDYSFGAGRQLTLTQQYSVILGYNNSELGSTSNPNFIMGIHSSAKGNSYVIGNNSDGSTSSYVFGSQCIAHNDSDACVLIGSQVVTNASADRAYGFGRFVRFASRFNTMVIGHGSGAGNDLTGYDQSNAMSIGMNSTLPSIVLKDGATATAANCFIFAELSVTPAGTGTETEVIGLGASGTGNDSVALGFNASADFNFSIAIGHDASVGSFSSVAIGSNAVAGQNSVALGENADADVVGGVAIGRSADAASSSISIGNGSSASGGSSVVIGTEASTANGFAVVIGKDATVTGLHGTAVGNSSTAVSDALALGRNSNAAYDESIAIGYGATTTKANQMLIGAASFEIDELKFFVSGSELTFDNSVIFTGNVAIGTTDLTGSLHISVGADEARGVIDGTILNLSGRAAANVPQFGLTADNDPIEIRAHAHAFEAPNTDVDAFTLSAFCNTDSGGHHEVAKLVYRYDPVTSGNGDGWMDFYCANSSSFVKYMTLDKTGTLLIDKIDELNADTGVTFGTEIILGSNYIGFGTTGQAKIVFDASSASFVDTDIVMNFDEKIHLGGGGEIYEDGAGGPLTINSGAPGVSVLTALMTSNEGIKLTETKGFAVKLTNKTGGVTVKGQVVIASTTDDAFETAGVNETSPIGVVLDAGVAADAEAWVVTSGIAEVLMDAGGATAGDRVITSATAGSADIWNVGGAVATHFQELGHCQQTRVGAGLARINLHLL